MSSVETSIPSGESEPIQNEGQPIEDKGNVESKSFLEVYSFLVQLCLSSRIALII